MWAAAEINDAAREAFIHRHISLSDKWIPRIEARSVASNPFLISQSLQKRLSQYDPAILHRMMCIDFQIPLTPEKQIRRGMFREQRQLVIKKRDTGSDLRFS